MLTTYASDLESTVPVLNSPQELVLPGEPVTLEAIVQLGDLAADATLGNILNRNSESRDTLNPTGIGNIALLPWANQRPPRPGTPRNPGPDPTTRPKEDNTPTPVRDPGEKPKNPGH